MKKQTKKLALAKDTLRMLGSRDMGLVAGGVIVQYQTGLCSTSTDSSTYVPPETMNYQICNP